MKIKNLDQGLYDIYQEMVSGEPKAEEIASKVHYTFALSAKNLYRYLILRSFDLRKFHDSLSDLGISSLRSSEGYVGGNLQNVIKNLRLIQGMPFHLNDDLEVIGYKRSKKILRKHANNLFNETRKKHFAEIMVTMPDEAAENKELVRKMVLNGMEIARIDLNKGDLEMWKKMIAIIDQVRKETKQKVKIFMDLSGQKIRTSKIEIPDKAGKIKDSIPVKVGEHIILTKRETLGKVSTFGKLGEQLEEAEIGVVLKSFIDDIKIDDPVFFDDGMIKAIAVSKNKTDVELVITECFKSKISSHKVINLPRTQLNLPSLTPRDMELLPFVCNSADILGYASVRKAEDVQKLYAELDKCNAQNLGIVFKIENQESFENLPLILFEGMKRSKIGVMIARGDLAVEMGYDRISEVQNQILWICEAAHVPVIWATRVLDNLAKSGVASRAEISDAAQSARAECVMLHKGRYILQAIRTLKNILIKMEAHTVKKKNALRSLNIAKKTLQTLHV